jgi:protein disulfide-isomerase A6
MLRLEILFLCFVAAASSTVVELKSDNWEVVTKGKTIWVKFCSQTCQHCKQMHIAWERLGDEFMYDENVVIGRVDCEKEETLCHRFEVLGTPTLLYGNPNDLKEYGGDKDFPSLKAWAVEALVPACSPDNLDLCNGLEKENISQWMKLSEGEMDKLISGVKDDEEAAHKEFDAKMQELQEQYNTFNDRNTLRQARIRKEIKFLKEIRAM